MRQFRIFIFILTVGLIIISLYFPLNLIRHRTVPRDQSNRHHGPSQNGRGLHEIYKELEREDFIIIPKNRLEQLNRV